ncbi:OLC1v1007338C1 [Oldenlandia corymbosa var. corymbosa]|uniref:RNA exonuclease 4 n=1 Tax=Oldenlandia corymbosa var. corymbosa TaxID=529605 RepID=A0AAV1DM59_OLDCO|nr:OLC1v1007338C1 [Oldenlandia corymbosa var. corymbosa]
MIKTTCVLSEIAGESDGGHKAVAIACEMVGGGSNGSLDLCARVCLVDEAEKLLFHTYVLPQIPVTDYRFEVTGIKEELLRDAMPLVEVQEKILRILYNGDSMESIRWGSVLAKVLVGHNLEHDLDCLRVNYPDHLLRDTAKYQPLMKTNLVSYSLKYLTKTYLGQVTQPYVSFFFSSLSSPPIRMLLNLILSMLLTTLLNRCLVQFKFALRLVYSYEIQNGAHDPYEDCVSAMRLYKQMRSQDHQMNKTGWSLLPIEDSQSSSRAFDSFASVELDQMTPDELFRISTSNYRCWCLDSLGQVL